MKKSMKGEAVLTKFQIQATRLNQLESRRLQRDIKIMEEDLKIHLLCLQKQVQNIKYHYTNVVQVVNPNPTYRLRSQMHTYQIAQDHTKNSLESIKLKQNSRSKTCQPVLSSNEVPSESMPPLLVLFGNDIKKPVEPIINFTENYLRPKTSPVKKYLSNQQRKNPLLPMINEHSINSNHPIRPQQSECNAPSFLPPIIPPNARKSKQVRFMIPTITIEKSSNLDALYRIALQNQTAYKSVDSTRIEKRKLLDKEFATQHRALKGIIRSTGLVK